MDYSPYQNRSRRSQGKGGKISIGLFLMSAFIGFLLFWGIKSLFFTEGGELSPVSYLSNSSRAEIMIAGDTSWGNLTSGSLVTQGDEIRIKKGNTSELVLKNNSKITLGLGSQLKMGEVRASESGEIFGEIFLEKGSILLDLKSAFSDDQLKIWLSKDTYLKASEGKLLFDQEGIAAISGENFYIQKVDSDGKVRYSKVLGIAQYLRFDSFSLQGIPEKIKSNPLVSGEFTSSEGLDNSENSDESNAGKNTPVLDLKSPIILEPVAHGEIKEVSKTTAILGTAPDGAEKILVEFSDTNGNSDTYELKNFLKGSKNWKYIASPNYNNMSGGRNIYKIYSVDAAGEKSSPSVIILDYKKPENSAQVFSSAQGRLLITSPNNGNATTQLTRVITLKGVAPSNASYITVVNKTLGTEYTLRGFKKGDKYWKYWTENMSNGTYVYLIKAQNSRRSTISSDTISITIAAKSVSTPSETTSTVSTSEVSTSETAR